MGSSCSCLRGDLIDEKQVCTDRNVIDIERNVLKSLEYSSKPNAENDKNLSLDIRVELSDIILLQSFLRGYLFRKKTHQILHSSLHSNQNLLETSLNSKSLKAPTNLSNISRSVLVELSVDSVPDYPNSTIKQILTKIGPFIFREGDISGVSRKGPVLLENGSVYTGDWNDKNERHGTGMQKWNDGAMYEGYWRNDKANGKGRLIHANGDVYEGDWAEDKAHGSGFYIHSDGAKYQGAWVSDKQHGFGVEVWPDGAKYQGAYVNGLKHGSGVFEWADGSRYQGDFCNNNIHGLGTYNWSDGRKFVGAWKDNKMHGKGNFTWTDGRSYEGYYENDKKHGQGVFRWADGRIYEGDWKDGKQDGKGIYTSPAGEVKQGEWKEGKRLKVIQT